MDLALLDTALAPAERLGLDTLDPRLQDIAGLAEAGDFTSAAERTEALLRDGVIDIRLLGYFFYGSFLENGPMGLPRTLAIITRLLGENWPAVGPAERKDKHAEIGLSWFFGRLTRRLESMEAEKSNDWRQWVTDFTAENAQATLERAAELKTALVAALQSVRCVGLVTKLEVWVRDFRAHAGGSSSVAGLTAGAPTAPTVAAAPSGAAPKGAAPNGAAAAASVIEGSFHLEQLRERLRAFEVLISKRNYEKALLVSVDIMNLIEKFDPRVYFPAMFSTYYDLMSKNVDKLAPFQANKDSVTWQALEQLYRVDLERFLK